MSYQVLARKWRPKKFEEVVSQDHVTTTLKNAITSDRIAGAYLFSGPRGVGKTTTARILAKAINCDQGCSPSPCNECSTCTEIASGGSLDVFEVDGASNRGIDEVRNLRENLKYAPSKNKYKIYIIDEVHMLTTEAFNALLKTLEEPPARVLFVFATTELHKVPATILSRCQRYDFRRIPTSTIADTLKEISASEKIVIAEEALYLIARKADGSLRDGQSLLDQVVSFSGQKVELENVRELLGVIDQDFFFECSELVANKDVAAGLELVEKVFRYGYDLVEFLNGLAEHFRNALVVKATGDVKLVEGLDSYQQSYRETGGSFSETDLLRLINLATDAAFHVKRSSNPKLILEMALVKMIKMDSSVQLDTLLRNLDKLEATGSSATGSVGTSLGGSSLSADAGSPPAQRPRSTGSATAGPVATSLGGNPPSASAESLPAQHHQPGTPSSFVTIKQISNVFKEAASAAPEVREASPVAPEPDDVTAQEASTVSLAKIKTDWPRIVDQVKSHKIHLGSFLNEGFPTDLTAGTLEVSFGKQGGFHLKTVEQNHAIVETAIAELTGFRLRLQCRKEDSEEFQEVLNEQQALLEQTSVDAKEDDALLVPIVKKVIEVFDGEIINS